MSAAYTGWLRCDAPGARDYSVEVFGGGRDAGDRPAPRRGALDRAGDVEARGERGARLALAGGHERRRFGGGALRQSAQQAGSSPSSRAGLAGDPSGVEAQARHPADRLGRIYRREPRRLQLLAVLRAVSGLRVEAVRDDAAGRFNFETQILSDAALWLYPNERTRPR